MNSDSPLKNAPRPAAADESQRVSEGNLNNLARRLASLPPAKRKLFEKLARSEAGAQTLLGTLPDEEVAPPAPSSGPVPASTRAKSEPPAVIPTGFVKWGEAPAADRKSRVSQFYNRINAQLTAAKHGEYALFLNYGYATTSQEDGSRVTLPEYCLNKNCIQLVCELVGDCPLEGCRVLDVGCGRGGTIHVLHTYFSPDATVGVDLSAEAIEFCRQRHCGLKATFLNGDAENLPFSDGEFDVITNVESSHSYPDVERFYRQVHRVLKGGGSFLYTDVLAQDQWAASLRCLQALGFAVEVTRDITENVLLACDLAGPAHQQAFEAANDAEIMANFLALNGSSVYGQMKQGVYSYRIYRLRKSLPNSTLST